MHKFAKCGDEFYNVRNFFIIYITNRKNLWWNIKQYIAILEGIRKAIQKGEYINFNCDF